MDLVKRRHEKLYNTVYCIMLLLVNYPTTQLTLWFRILL